MDLILDNISCTLAPIQLGFYSKSSIWLCSREKRYTCLLNSHTTESNTTGSKIAKSIITRLTNRSNLGGTRLLRGYPEVEKQNKTKTSTTPKALDQERKLEQSPKGTDDALAAQQEMDDYDNEDSEEEVRKVDHLVFVIHG